MFDADILREIKPVNQEVLCQGLGTRFLCLKAGNLIGFSTDRVWIQQINHE